MQSGPYDGLYQEVGELVAGEIEARCYYDQDDEGEMQALPTTWQEAQEDLENFEDYRLG